MSQTLERLQRSSAEFPEHAPLSGERAVKSVIRRGRRRILAARVVGGTLAVTLTAGGAAALPHLLVPKPETPTIMGEVPDVDPPADKVVVEPKPDAAPKFAWDGDDKPAAEVGDYVKPEPESEPEPAKEPVVTTTKEPEPKPTTKPAPVTTFSAVQAWNVSDSEPPGTVYEGTGVPGHGVWVYSEYGEANGTIKSDGTFRIEAAFPNAPYGTKTFPVKVKDTVTGEKILFEFTTVRAGTVGEVAFTAIQKENEVSYRPPYSHYKGTATPGTHIDVTSEFGSASGEADVNGNWYVKVWFEGIPEGESRTFPVTVTHRESGQQQVFEFTGHHPGVTVAFSANQQNGSSPDALPWDVFYGTAEPNTVVRVWADYEGWPGWVETVANADGNWEVRVEFPNAPANQPFAVKTMSDFTGEKVYFDFVATYA